MTPIWIALSTLIAGLAVAWYATSKDKKGDLRLDAQEVAKNRIAKSLQILREAFGDELYDKLVKSGKKPKYENKNALELLMMHWAPYDEIILQGSAYVFAWQARLNLEKEQIGTILVAYMKKMAESREQCFKDFEGGSRLKPWTHVRAAQKIVEDELYKEFIMPILTTRGH